MRLGILGGTFDPVHFGHIKTAEYCKEKLNLNLILFIPAGCPPLKKAFADYIHRVEMVKLAIDEYKYFKVSEFEKKKEENHPTYTYDTLRTIKKLYPKAEIIFLVGTDNVLEIKRWYKYKDLFKFAKFVVVSRDVSSRQSWRNLDYYNKLHFINMPLINISSHTIRHNIINNISIDGFLPKKVEKYIKKNQIYLKET